MIPSTDIDALSRFLRRPDPTASSAAVLDSTSPLTREAATVAAEEETRVFIAFGAGAIFVRHHPRSAPSWLMPTLESLGRVLGSSLVRPNPLTLQYAVGLLPLVMLDQTPLPNMVLTPTGALRFQWASDALNVDITVLSLGAARLLIADRLNNEIIEGDLSSQLNRLRPLMVTLPARQDPPHFLRFYETQTRTPILTNANVALHRSQPLIDLARRAATSIAQTPEGNIDDWADTLVRDVAQLED